MNAAKRTFDTVVRQEMANVLHNGGSGDQVSVFFVVACPPKVFVHIMCTFIYSNHLSFPNTLVGVC